MSGEFYPCKPDIFALTYDVEVKVKAGRESGFYWVKDSAEDWRVAEWSASWEEWSLPGIDENFDEFDEIGERIERKGE